MAVETDGADRREDVLRVFVSYAWEGSLAPKAWLSEVVERLSVYGIRVFFDRHCLGYGDHIEAVIDEQLAMRPLVVLCMCDSAYCAAARTPGTGVHAELLAIGRLQGAADVAIVPVLLEAHSRLAADMPPVLGGRLALALGAARDRGLDLSYPLLDLLRGETQEAVQGLVDRAVATFDLRARLEDVISRCFHSVSGDPETHFVRMDGSFLNVPACMRSDREFAYYIESESCDGQVRWWWSGRGLGTRFLGAAIVGHCFPAADFSLLYEAGRRLAMGVFGFIREHEGLVMWPADVVQALTADAEGCDAADSLLATLCD